MKNMTVKFQLKVNKLIYEILMSLWSDVESDIIRYKYLKYYLKQFYTENLNY